MAACWRFTASPRKGPTITSPTWPRSCPCPRPREDGPGEWVGSGRRGAGPGGTDRAGPPAGRPRRTPSDVRGPVALGPGHRARVRPDLQRAEVGQRGLRVGRRGSGRSGAGRTPQGRAGRAATTSSPMRSRRDGARGAARDRPDDRPGGGVVHPWRQSKPRPASAHPCRGGQHGPRARRPVERMRPSRHVGASCERRRRCTSRTCGRSCRGESGCSGKTRPGCGPRSGAFPRSCSVSSLASADIRRHMAARGSHSARGARVAWAATRPEKQSGLGFARAGVRMGAPRPVGGRRSRRHGRASSRPRPERARAHRSTSTDSGRCFRWHPMARHVGATSSPRSARVRSRVPMPRASSS